MPNVPASLVKILRERTGLGLMDCKKALLASDGDVDQAIENMRKQGSLKSSKKSGRLTSEGLLSMTVSADKSMVAFAEINIETDFAARNPEFVNFCTVVTETAIQLQSDAIKTLLEHGLEAKLNALIQLIGENISIRRLVLVKQPTDGHIGCYLHTNDRVGALVTMRGGDVDLRTDIAMQITASNPMVVNPSDIPEEILAKEKSIYLDQSKNNKKPEHIISKIIAGRIKKFASDNSLIEQPFIKDQDKSVHQMVADANAKILAFVRFEVGEGIDKKTQDFAAEVSAQITKNN